MLLDLESQLLEARSRYTDSHPTVVDLKAQAGRLRQQIEDARAQARIVSEQARETAAQARVTAEQARETADQARLQVGLARLDSLWRNRGPVSQLNLTPAQVKQMEDIFQQHRLKLIDLNAALEKEEVRLEPLVAADTLDEAKLIAQIDRVAQARAELEKSRGRMLIGIRKVLEVEQWRKLNEMGFSVTSR
jgi:hypothetical protein